MNPSRIKIENHGNPFRRTYHTTARLCRNDERGDRITYLHWGRDTGALDSTTSFLRSIMAIDGVVDFYLEPFSLSIGIGKAFEWADCESRVIEVLKMHFPQLVATEIRGKGEGKVVNLLPKK